MPNITNMSKRLIDKLHNFRLLAKEKYVSKETLSKIEKVINPFCKAPIFEGKINKTIDMISTYGRWSDFSKESDQPVLVEMQRKDIINKLDKLSDYVKQIKNREINMNEDNFKCFQGIEETLKQYKVGFTTSGDIEEILEQKTKPVLDKQIPTLIANFTMNEDKVGSHLKEKEDGCIIL
ncbi:hypothetical protein [Piscirickettsia salmonis]|uniref:hypothetical protein n=1 Tax=Piscirickettsia salmonis TaxID=1238 RepID=UPI0007C97D61|nr:hypothetical protein A0O36_00349 [Piscirickettsiaceae bacterium NZ-RLO1]